MNNIVIKSLNRDHGYIVIDFWRSNGVDTGKFRGTINEKDGDIDIYYGVINGKFANYSLDEVIQAKAKIVKLEDIVEDISKRTIDGITLEVGKSYYIAYKYNALSTIKLVKITRITDHGFAWSDDNGGIITDSYNVWRDTDHTLTTTTQNTTMQKLSRQGLKEIHSVACPNWKDVLEHYGSRNPLEDYIDLTQEEVNKMFEASTKDQLPIVSKYLKQDDGSVDVSKLKVEGKGISANESSYIIRDREMGKYQKKSFLLSPWYNWEIKEDELGFLCLIPTKKK
jgi:hypothetical protein